jgi:hypothetical protein
MDPNQGNSQVNGTQPPYAQPPYGQPPYAQPPYAQPPYAQPPQGTVVPMDGGWAPGVYPVPVSPRSHRLRWTAAGAVVLCVAIVTAAAAFVLSGAAGAKSLTSSVAPKDTIAFLEVRTDLPGDQRAKLADFMSHFPGFQDRAQFDTALDEMLNRLTSSVSPDLAYTSAFKPWMEGEVSIAEMGPGTGAALTGSAVGSVSLPSTVAIFALKDRAAAQTWVNSELDRLKLAASPQDYAGTKLYTAGVGIGAEGAYAFTDQDLLVGTVDGVKAALDSKTKGSLTDNPDYQAAMKSFSGDSLARFYLAARALVASELDSLNAAMQQLSSAASAPIPTLGISSATTPAWIAGSVRSESDRMVVDVAYPSPNDTSSGNHASRLANALPGSTVGAVEVHSLGKLLTDGLAAAEAGLPGNSTLGNVKTVLGLMGGLDWIGDGVAAVTKDGSNFSEGFVVQATDASTAGSKVALISNAVSFAGWTYGLKSHDEQYKGATITLIDVPESVLGMPLEIAVAAKDDLVVVGYGDAFVKAVIDTTSSTSLGSQPDYSAAMAAAGSSNVESIYVNVPALEDQIGQAVLSKSASVWAQDYKPYFDHLGSVAGSVVGGNTVILRLVITAK